MKTKNALTYAVICVTYFSAIIYAIYITQSGWPLAIMLFASPSFSQCPEKDEDEKD